MLHIKTSGVNAADGILINNTGGTTADAIIRFENAGTPEWTLGFDDSDLDQFKISQSTNLGTSDAFIIDSDRQLFAGITGTAAAPAWSFDADTDIGMYRATTNELAFSTAGTERLRIDASGFVGIDDNNPSTYLEVDATAWPEINLIDNSDAGGTGTIMIGQNGTYNGLVAGSGSSSCGITTGLYGYYSTGGVGEAALYQDAFGAQWNVGYWSGGAYFKIIGNGSVSTIVKNPQGEEVTMFCVEAPENLFQDYGEGTLSNGVAHISLDPIFSNSIQVDEEHPIRVYVQLEGDCAGVYVTNKTKDGFTVKELAGGSSNANFTYTVVATRGQEVYQTENGVRIATYDQRYPAAPAKKQNLIQAGLSVNTDH